jgi:hypothetical protein
VRLNRGDNATYNEIKYVTSGDTFYFNQANGGAYSFNISGTPWLSVNNTGAATFGGNVTGKNATFVTTTAASLISIGDTAAGTYSLLRMYGGSGKYNFQVGVQNNVDNGFEITPSTAVGGTTFTTPALLIDGTTGAATFSGSVALAGSSAGLLLNNSATADNTIPFLPQALLLLVVLHLLQD